MDALLGWFFRLFNRGFDRCTGLYLRSVAVLLRGCVIVLVVYAGLLAMTWWGLGHVPTGFIPQQDKGYLLVNVQLPEAASVERTQAVIDRLDRIARSPSLGGVAHTVGVAGESILLSANAPNFGSMFLILDPFDKRRDPRLADMAIAQRLQAVCYKEIPEAVISVFGAPPVDGLGTAAGFKLMVEDRGDLGLRALQKVTDDLIQHGRQEPRLDDLFTLFRSNTPQLFADIDRVKAKSLGVAVADVFNTLEVYLGSYYVNNFNEFDRCWQVKLQADGRFRRSANQLGKLKVRNGRGETVPLSTVTRLEDVNGPVMVTRYNMYPAAPINGDVAPGVSSGQGIKLMEQLASAQLPRTMGTEWTELSLMEIEAAQTGSIKELLQNPMTVFVLAVVLVFLVLAAQYESWSLPLAVILVVPMCLLCSTAGVAIARMDVNIFTQIGFVVLVGLASKNAILIVEFARQRRLSGESHQDATLAACRLRLRPIMMTSLAFILGVIPLVMANGAGAEMRRTLGTAVFSGMLGVTLFGIFLTPVFFLVIDRLSESGPFQRRPARKIGAMLLSVLSLGFVPVRRRLARRRDEL